MDRATGEVRTQRVLSPASPFLKDGWYRAIILAQDDGERHLSLGSLPPVPARGPCPPGSRPMGHKGSCRRARSLPGLFCLQPPLPAQPPGPCP